MVKGKWVQSFDLQIRMANMSKNLWDPDSAEEFKLFDEVIISEISRGYIDAITYDRYRIRLQNGGYEWVFRSYNGLIHADKERPIKKTTRLDYLK
jgi:hypothetical protein